MIALIIDAEIREKINRLIQHATDNPFPLAVMEGRAKRYASGEMRPEDKIGKEFGVAVPIGFYVSFTHEEHQQSIFLRHISISQLGERLPNRYACEQLLSIFEFQMAAEDVIMFPEDLDHGMRAVNMLEPLDPADWGRLRKKGAE